MNRLGISSALVVVLWLLLSGASSTSSVSADGPTLVIRGGRLFDGTGAPSRPLGALVVTGERIAAILPPGEPFPPDATVVDATGCTVLPGLFDLHVHTAVPGSFGLGTMPKPEANLASHLACGVTNVVDLHGNESSIFALRDASRASAQMARLYVAGAAFTVPQGHCTQFGIPANEVSSDAEVAARFEKLLARKPDVIKAALEHGGWGGIPAMPTLSDELFASISKRTRDARLPLFVHVWSLEEARTATRLGARALAHGVFLGSVDADLLAEMKAKSTAYVPTISVVIAGARALAKKPPYARPLAKEALHPDLYAALNDEDAASSLAASPMARLGDDAAARALANLKAVAAAGIEIGLGTDAGNPFVPHGPGVLHEIALYVEAGLSPTESLRAATLGSARILGVADRFGSLEVGKVADVVIVRGDPTTSITDVWNVEKVVKGGVVVDRAALAARNRETARPAEVLVAGGDVPVEVDSFEDGDLVSGWRGRWAPWSDSIAPGGKSTCAGEVVADGGAKLLRLKGTIAPGFQWGPWAGVQLEVDPEKRVHVDASKYTGLRLRVRGTPRPYSLTVLCAAVKDFNFFSIPLAVKEDWTEIEIPFASIRQIGFGKPVTWTGKDLIGFTIDARNPFGGTPVNGEFTMDIDWLRLY